jgi:extracellular elastinolytic metalloproteinase
MSLRGRTGAARVALAVALVAVPGTAVAAAPGNPGPAAQDPGFVDVRPHGPATTVVTRRNGFLTRPSERPPRAIALDYVRGHPGLFRLDADDVEGLEPASRQRLPVGLQRVQFTQVSHGIPALDAGLRATLDERGRIVSVTGAPRPDLAAAGAPEPRLDASDALQGALRFAGEPGVAHQVGRASGPTRETRFAGGHVARLVWFTDGAGARLAWRVLVAPDSQHLFDTVVDARDGRLLRRRNLVKSTSALVWENYPGAPLGGAAATRDLSAPGWLPEGSNKLLGPNAWVYADPHDELYGFEDGFSDPPDAPDVQIGPDGTGNWEFPQAPFPHVLNDGRSCPVLSGFGTCSWDVNDPASRDENKGQNGTQVFYFVNRFHDHLVTAPGIGFTAAAGGFEGDDPLHAQVLDGIAAGSFFSLHTNNANMLPLPDDYSPRMQMYLFTGFGSAEEPGVNTAVNDVNGGDDAAIVYHEYAHGMNNRLLCCDADGWSLIGGPQSGAMDEAWADWYTMDFLEAGGLIADSGAAGEVRFGDYESFPVRFQPVDCPAGLGGAACPGSFAAACGSALPGVPGAGSGGFTYGDFGRICQLDDGDGVPDGEVHADGEIWASTLWDLRSAMIAAHGRPGGLYRTRALVTGGLVVAPGFPDFLDMRDAILTTNTALGFGQGDCERIWTAFAGRGMGSNASSAGDGDTTPTEGFANPGAAACGGAPGPGPGTGPIGGGTATPAGPRKPNLRGASGRIRVSPRGIFTYPIRAAAGLRGIAVFRTRVKALVSGRRAHLSLARKAFHVGASGRVVLRVKLSRRNRGVLRRNRKLLLRAVVTVRDGAGRSAVATRRLTLLRP